MSIVFAVGSGRWARSSSLIGMMLPENRLSQQLGEQAWRDSGLGAPTDIDHLQRQVTTLEQRVVELQGQLEDRTDELQAARAANRELTRTLNQTHG